jgi:hypothetical protein
MNLAERALLVQLNISQWSARKYDKRVSKAVSDSSNASSDAGRYNKALLPGADKLEAVHKMSTKIRNEYYRQTLPWSIEGTQLLTADNYMDFMADMGQLKGEWEALVNDFVNEYPRLVSAAQQKLGDLYEPDDYPPVGTIREKFRIGMNKMPVPTTDIRVSLAADELDSIRADIESSVRKAEQAAMGELWDRLYKRVKHIADSLSDPDKKFQASLLENAWELCAILPKMNVAGDPNLEQMRRELEAALNGKNPDVLRTSPAVRADTAKKAADIASKMGAFMGGDI